MKLLKMGTAILLALLLAFSTSPFDQVALAATLICDEGIKLPNGWNTPGLDQLERITTFTGNDSRTIFHQDGINQFVLRIQKKDGYAQIGVALWYIQPTKIIIDFDIYFEAKGLGVYRLPCNGNDLTNFSGNQANSAAVLIQPPDALVEIRIGEVRVRPADEPAPTVNSVTLSQSSLSLLKGKTAQLTATVSPDDAPNKAVSWKSSNTKVAKVDSDGLVKAVGAGTATITVTTKQGKKTAKCKVTVKKLVALKSISKIKTAYVQVGNTHQVNPVLNPKKADVTLSYASSNPDIASIDENGLIAAHASGTATIKVSASPGGKSQSFTVSTGIVPATAVRLNKTKGSLKRGKSEQLTATMLPEEVSPSALIWKSSNTKIVRVSDAGEITALRKGTATITATTWNGLKATCKITVK